MLTAAGIDPTAAHTLRCAADEIPLDSIRPYRGWTEKDWDDAAGRLRDRGWIDDAGRTTPEGARARDGIERDTDRLAAELVDRIADLDLVTSALTSVTVAIERADAIPYPNPIGVPRR